MKKRIIILLLLLCVCMVPKNIFAKETLLTSPNKVITSYYYNYHDNTGHEGSYYFGNDWGDDFIYHTNSYIAYRYSLSTSFSIGLQPDVKYSLRLKFNTGADTFVNTDEDSSFKNINFEVTTSDGTLYTLQNAEDYPFFKYFNYGIKKVFNHSNSSDVLFYDTYFVIDFVLSEKITKLSFEYKNFDSSNSCSDSTDFNLSRSGLDFSIVPQPTCILPIASNTGYTYYDLKYNGMSVYQVDEFDFLQTKITDLPDFSNLPDYHPYEPDDSGLKDLKTCNQENLLDRFSCYFDNIGIWFSNTFNRLGNFFKTLNDNVVLFFSNFLENLKSLFIPQNMDFINDFKDTLERKLGFIAEIPLKLLDFLFSLSSASWEEFNSISFPSIEMFGVCFWDDMTIDLTEAKNIFGPFKYLTDIACVVLCVNTLVRWYENFANGGDK